MNNIKISTNKMLHTLLFMNDKDIKSKTIYNADKQLVEEYYIQKTYEDTTGSKYTIKLSSTDKNNLSFTIDEVYLYLILLMNAITSNDEDYHISFRKIRAIRELRADSTATYDRHFRALERLLNKKVTITPIKMKYQMDLIVSSPLLKSCSSTKSRCKISDVQYEFDKFGNMMLKSKQIATSKINIFKYSLKQDYSFQVCLYLIRNIFMNSKKNEVRNCSFQHMLKCCLRYTKDGFLTGATYYDYISTLANKQSEYLSKCYKDTICILNELKKYKMIRGYKISQRKSFKYLRDNEVELTLYFYR